MEYRNNYPLVEFHDDYLLYRSCVEGPVVMSGVIISFLILSTLVKQCKDLSTENKNRYVAARTDSNR